MSIFTLKSTKCDGICSFTSISYYCFDCPALMCFDCRNEMHANNLGQNHKILAFKNNNLNWNDKCLMMNILGDLEMANNTFDEVSRNIKLIKINSNTESSEGLTWSCERCSYKNDNKLLRCEMCYIIREVEEENREYDKKLNNFSGGLLKQFIDLDKKYTLTPEIPFENVINCYIKDREENISLNIWYRQYYPHKKYFDVVNDIIQKFGFSVTLNDLDKQYTEILNKKNKKLLNYICNQEMIKEIKKSPEVNSIDVNKHNKIPISIVDKSPDDSYVWKVISKNTHFTEPEKRLLMTEMDLQSHSPLDLLQVFLKSENLGQYLREECPNGNVRLHHVKQAITDQVSIDGAMNFLQKSCLICSFDYPMPEMRGFITCQHEFCKSCVYNWLAQTIETKYPCKWNCPVCPDNIYQNIDKNLYYAQLKDILGKNKNLVNIFESKLLLEQLMQSQNFHWCANEACTNGFEAEGIEKIVCPSCTTSMCVKCNRIWQEAHENRTCQEFELWMLKNDPNLSQLLKDIGIECPGCGMRYALAPGGCLHFDCKACGIKFCGGCDQLFVDKCNKPNCQMTSFHSHHPRNCLYFLRDYQPNELENMLKDSDYPKLVGKPEKMCQFMITTDQLKEISCNKEVHGTAGLCEQHYKEYLVQFINRYEIDPADFADNNSLNMMLFQMAIEKLAKINKETDAQFKDRLKKKVKEACLFYIPKGLIKMEIPQN